MHVKKIFNRALLVCLATTVCIASGCSPSPDSSSSGKGSSSPNEGLSLEPASFHVDTLPSGSDRFELVLDGIWECTATYFDAYDRGPLSIPDTFETTMPVPGLWDQAEPELYSFDEESALWVRTTVTLPSVPEGRAVLQIGKACYGRYIYVNGEFVDEYPYNFTSSLTDVTDYLQAGENEIGIMLGNRSQQTHDPLCPAHTGWEMEKDVYYPGIIDSVRLIFCGDPSVTALQTAPDLDNGTVAARVTLENRSDTASSGDVVFRVYERGIYENGQPVQEKKLVGTYTVPDVSVDAGATRQVDVEAIPIEDFSADKWWSPEHPFLYEIEIETAGDTYTERFGMRTFGFDPETKLPMLNGEVHYLRGTNIVMGRFYEDPLHGNYPFDAAWARKLYAEFKSMHWDTVRFHIGNVSEIWYDVADEEGFLIMDEYPYWGSCGDYPEDCTVDTLAPEVKAWIEEKGNHPSVIHWDIQNEAYDDPLTGEVIQAVRDYDLQGRGWDNGWSEPPGETDTCECHPYPFADLNFTLSSFNSYSNEPHRNSFALWENDNPKILNEYGWLWLDRNGNVTSLGKDHFDKYLPDATPEERLEYYAKVIAQSTEFWREGRHHAGILQFCGLSYSIPGRETSDILMPDISTPTVRPCIKEAFRNAFAPVGIVIRDWSESVDKGTVRELPVTVINDLNEDIENLEVTLTVYKDGVESDTYHKTYSVRQAGDANGEDRQTQTFSVTVPETETASTYTVTASYTMNGETVESRRDWILVDPT